MGLPRTVSEIKSDICKILPPRVFKTPLMGSSWNFVAALGLTKIRMMPLPESQKSVTTCAFV